MEATMSNDRERAGTNGGRGRPRVRPWLVVQPEAIPSALRPLGWVLWRAQARGKGKPVKVPYTVIDPRRCASSTDPTTWAPFGDAVEAYSALPDVAGIGVVLTAADGISCIDL